MTGPARAGATVPAVLYYGAPSPTAGPDAEWIIDAVERPGEILYRNFDKVPIRTAVTDLRHGGFQPKLDDAGFERVEAATAVDHQELLDGSPTALARYQQETGAMLQSLTGADDVVFFDATFRLEDTEAPRGPSWQPPHLRVHIDQNPTSARARAAIHGGADRRFRRFQIVNIWRPLLEPVRNYPLALCDYRSLDRAEDLVVTRLVYPPWLHDRENYSVTYRPRHRWYHWSGQTPDEAVVFKCHDSAEDVAALCPHTAFLDPHGATTGRLRTSLELRALLFHG